MEFLLGIITSALWVILGIGLLVFIHELGHFLAAKYFGMRVERFSVGFPPNMLSRRYGETEYVVGATPLGGYVQVAGMLDESLDTETLSEAPEPHEYRAKPIWQRMIFITAGVIFNAILAVLIFAGINFSQGQIVVPAENVDGVYVYNEGVGAQLGMQTGDRVLSLHGEPLESYSQIQNLNRLVAKDTLRVTVDRNGDTLDLALSRDAIITRANRMDSADEPPAGGVVGISVLPSMISQVSDGFPADSIGLRSGDRIVGLGADTIRFWVELTQHIEANQGQPLTVRWVRPDSVSAVPDRATRVGTVPSGIVYEATLTPQKEGERYILGVTSPSAEMIGVESKPYGPGGALVAGANQTWEFSKTIVISLKRVITGQDDPRESLGGPVKIVEITSSAAAAGPVAFWRIVAILSITLAIMNILPIPALDGGHLVFLLYEIVTRREPSTRFRLMAQQIGMILLLGFITFLIFNDIMRL